MLAQKLLGATAAGGFQPLYLRNTATVDLPINSGQLISVTTPTVAAGDILFMICMWTSGSNTGCTFTTPTGMTLLSSHSSAFTSESSIFIFYRRCTGSEASSYSSQVNRTGVARAAMFVIGDSDPSKTPSAASSSTDTNTSTVTAPSVAASAKNLLLFVGVGTTSAGPVRTFTPPSGMTEAIDSARDGGSFDMFFTVAWQSLTSSGATGTRSATLSGTAAYVRAISILVE